MSTFGLLVHGNIVAETFTIPKDVFIITVSRSDVPLTALPILRVILNDIARNQTPKLFKNSNRSVDRDDDSDGLETKIFNESIQLRENAIDEINKAIHYKQISIAEGRKKIEEYKAAIQKLRLNRPRFRMHLPRTPMSEHTLEVKKIDNGGVVIKGKKEDDLATTKLSSFVEKHGPGVYVLMCCRGHAMEFTKKLDMILTKNKDFLEYMFPTSDQRAKNIRELEQRLITTFGIPRDSEEFNFIMSEYNSPNRFDAHQRPIENARLLKIFERYPPQMKKMLSSLLLIPFYFDLHIKRAYGIGDLEAKRYIDAYHQHLSLAELRESLETSAPMISALFRQRSDELDENLLLDIEIMTLLEEKFVDFTEFFKREIQKYTIEQKRQLLNILKRISPGTNLLQHEEVTYFLDNPERHTDINALDGGTKRKRKRKTKRKKMNLKKYNKT